MRLAAIATLLLLTPMLRGEIKTDIEYGTAGDERLLLDAGIPDSPGPHPIAILVHGGGWSSGDKAKDFLALKPLLDQANFTWFSINYRLAPKNRWPACFDDVQTAIKWVKAHAAEYHGDPARIAVAGYSAGGQLVCMAAVKATDETRVQAIIGYAAPTDLEMDLPTRGGLSESLQDLLNRPHELTDESRQLLRDLSAVHFVKPNLPPFLLVHGTADKSVPYPSSVNFQAALKAANVLCELITLKDAPHSIAQWEKSDPNYAKKTVTWLQQTLTEKPAAQSAVAPPTKADGSARLNSPKSAVGHPAGIDAIVSQDNTGDFANIQDAIMATPQANPPAPWTILIKPGTYHELLYAQREKRLVKLLGEDADKTIVTFGLYANRLGPDDKKIGTFRTPTATIDADDFTCENLTIANSAGAKGQALAVRIDGDRITFRHCRFLGWQDTVFTNRGRHYFKDCYIQGATDFIFGGGTDYFDHCHIHCQGNGYITAASTPAETKYGYVFDHCTIDGEHGVKTYLGRPWRPFAATAFLNCEMSNVVRREGWNNWGKPDREKTTRYAEYKSTGDGGGSSSRVPWAKQLSDEQARPYEIRSVLAGSEAWDPKR